MNAIQVHYEASPLRLKKGGRMKPNQKKTYPSHALTDGLRAKNIMARCLWETPGPVNTQIAWLAAYLVCAPGKSGGVVIVQTYAGDGWDAYTSLGENDVDATIADVIERLKVGGDATAEKEERT